jgi:hypothetical protein
MTIEIIHNAATGEITERPFTKAELAEYEKNRLEQEKLIAAQAVQINARQAVLEKLGLTEEEAALLLA